MTDLTPTQATSDDTLELFFDGPGPFHASRLGELLTALSADYRRSAQGAEDFILVFTETGSLKIVLQTVAGVAAGAMLLMTDANTLVDFGKNLTGAIEWVYHSGEALDTTSRRPCIRAARAVLETAGESESGIRLECRGKNGQRVTLNLSADETKAIHKRSRVRHHRIATPMSSASRPRPQDVRALDQAIDEIAERESSARPFTSEEKAGFALAIRIIVRSIEDGGSAYVIDDAIQRLNAQGLYEFAEIVRDARRGRGAPERQPVGDY